MRCEVPTAVNVRITVLGYEGTESYRPLEEPAAPVFQTMYVGYSEIKLRLRISLVRPRDCHFTHVR